MTARYAILVNDHGRTMEQVYNLTPRQIHELYFHPRDENGGIKLPDLAAEAEMNPADRLAQLIAMAPNMNDPPEQIEALKRRLEALTNGDR